MSARPSVGLFVRNNLLYYCCIIILNLAIKWKENLRNQSFSIFLKLDWAKKIYILTHSASWINLWRGLKFSAKPIKGRSNKNENREKKKQKPTTRHLIEAPFFLNVDCREKKNWFHISNTERTNERTSEPPDRCWYGTRLYQRHCSPKRQKTRF